MREIKFRGKSARSLDKLNESDIEHVNGWVYGNLVMYGDTPFIVVLSLVADVYDYWVKVHPESVGQYTGLKDKNGRDIYEGDVLKNDYGELWVVVWEGTGFMLSLNGDSKNIYSANEYYFSSCEVIGNTYENKQLLEDERRFL